MEGERKKKEEEKERKRKAHNFIEVHKEDLGGETVASSSVTFNCSHH